MGYGHAFFELPGADAHEYDAVMMLGIHIGLNLEYEGRKLIGRQFDDAFGTGTGLGWRSKAQEFFQERFDAEIGHG